ncbi:MAG: histidine triad nucleotide-binding protein [Planctomycetes bacterium]|nr:histidine triad nucleotide-binding protein [Planctomycetota bacterium]
MSDNCIFCKILAKEIPSAIIAESSNCIAIDDKFPQAPVHILVIPRRHIASLHDTEPADRDLLGELLELARKCSEIKGIAEKGYRVITNIGVDGGQGVFHLHIHVLGGKKLGAKLINNG